MEQLKFGGMDGIDEVTLISIHVKIGQDVKKGDSVFDIEADKAADTITSPYDGKVSKINFKSGDTIKTGDVVVEFGGSAASTDSEPEVKAEPKVQETVEKQEEVQPTPAAQPAASVEPEPVAQEQQAQTPSEPEFKATGTVLATPLARKIAHELGVDINTVKGTGPNGRILRTDIENAKNGGTTASPAAQSAPSESASDTSASTAASTSSSSATNVAMNVPGQAINVAKIESFGPVEHMPISGIRRATANMMVTSKYTATHVTLMLDVDATNLVSLRKTLKEEAIKPENGAIKLTFMPFFIKAVAKALTEDRFKLMNSTFNLPGNEILVKKYYNIGMAADTDKGLLVPVIKNADKLSLFDIAKEVNQLADKARKGALTAAEMQGGTFTITNFGSAGLKIGTPIINYPEVAILGIGILESKAVQDGSDIVLHSFFPLSLSIDHRVIDGAPAGYFLQRVKELLENPALLLLP